MKWNKLTIETTTAAEDMLSYELSEMGMEGVEIEDHAVSYTHLNRNLKNRKR